MAITVQTNDGLSTANSYVSVTDFDAYTMARGIAITGNPEQLLLSAMDVLESKQYKSEPLNTTQSTLFPRAGLNIPRNIKQAQIMLAVAADTTDLMAATTEAQVKKEKVDVIETEYFEGVSNASPLLKTVNELLSPYLASTKPWVANVAVYRG